MPRRFVVSLPLPTTVEPHGNTATVHQVAFLSTHALYLSHKEIEGEEAPRSRSGPRVLHAAPRLRREAMQARVLLEELVDLVHLQMRQVHELALTVAAMQTQRDANGRCPAHTRVPASFSNERTPGSCAIVIQAGSTSSAASSMQGQQRESGLSSVSLSLSCTYQELSANDFIGVLGLGRLFSLLVRSPVLIITEVIPAPPAIISSLTLTTTNKHTRRVHTSTFAQQSRNTPTPAPPQVASIRGCPREQ